MNSNPTQDTGRRRRKTWIVLAAVVIIVAVVAGVFYVTSLSSGPPAAPSGPNVIIWNGTFCNGSSNCGFVPNVKNIIVGTTVTWTTDGSVTHTVTTCDSNHSVSQCPTMNPSGLDSLDASVSGGSSYSHTFNVAGTYHYYCRPHSWMQGTIVVS